MEQELCEEIDHPEPIVEPAEHLTVGIDGAFVKAKRSASGQRRQFEVLTGRIERKWGRGQAFAVVRDLASGPGKRCKPYCVVVDEGRIPN